MREILFRGKRIDNGEWIKGLFIKDFEFYGQKDEHSYIVTHKHPSGCFGSDIYFEVAPETVGQYTGLTDKNGNKIFEGDILIIKTTLDSVNEKTRYDEYTAYGVVVFNEGHFELEGKGLVLCTYWGVKVLSLAAHFKKYEVIGNIHDNPELLEGE